MGRCPVCGWPVGNVPGHVRIAHPDVEYVQSSYGQADALYRAAREMVAAASPDECCPVWTAEDSAEMRERFGLPEFGTIGGRAAIRWPDGRIETGPETED